MKNLSKKSIIYFDPKMHQALRLRAASTRVSNSALVNEAVGLMMQEDQEDLAAFAQRAKDAEISRDNLLADLKRHVKL